MTQLIYKITYAEHAVSGTWLYINLPFVNVEGISLGRRPPGIRFKSGQGHACLYFMMTSSNFLRYWSFEHRSPVDSHHKKGQWRGALIFSLIYAWTNGWVNHWDAGDLRRHRSHYDITVILELFHPVDELFGTAWSIFTMRPKIDHCVLLYMWNWKPFNHAESCHADYRCSW